MDTQIPLRMITKFNNAESYWQLQHRTIVRALDSDCTGLQNTGQMSFTFLNISFARRMTDQVCC